MSDNIVFPRGSKTTRVKTARVTVGDRLLTRNYSPAGNAGSPGQVFPTESKTDAIVRVVESKEFQLHQGHGFHGRAGRTYTIFFTDGTKVEGLAPIFTWHALVTDTASSASRQHFIDTGYYLTEAEVAEYISERTPEEYAELVTLRDEEPDAWGPTPAQEEGWDVREDYARGSVL